MSSLATDATEAAVREAAATHRFLHLATHGYFAPEALKSALGRTPGASEAGRRCSAGSACRATIRGCSRAWR